MDSGDLIKIKDIPNSHLLFELFKFSDTETF